MVHKISEARFNDLVYMTLKEFFFQPSMSGSPRECDIIICMDLICQTSDNPYEKSRRSHTVFYDVDTDKCFDECLDYVEGHWIKQSIDEFYGKPVRAEMKKWYDENLVPAILSVPEELCGA